MSEGTLKRESQLDKFKEAARELECDDDKKRFADRLGKLIKPTPKPEKEPNR